MFRTVGGEFGTLGTVRNTGSEGPARVRIQSGSELPAILVAPCAYVSTFTPRFTAYAAAHGCEPDAMIARDRERFPGGLMAGFVVWCSERHRAWCAATGRRADVHMSPADHAAYDRWLATGGGA